MKTMAPGGMHCHRVLNTARTGQGGGRSQELRFFCRCVILDKPLTFLALSFVVCETVMTYFVLGWVIYVLAWD